MRRKDREIIEISRICEILEKCAVMRLAMSVDNKPYIVPLNFGYSCENDEFSFYFHGATEGKKLDLIRENPFVCAEFDCEHELLTADAACAHSYRYESVIASGNAAIIEDVQEKKYALSEIMRHMTGKTFDFTDMQVAHVAVCKITETAVTAKAKI